MLGRGVLPVPLLRIGADDQAPDRRWRESPVHALYNPRRVDLAPDESAMFEESIPTIRRVKRPTIRRVSAAAHRQNRAL